MAYIPKDDLPSGGGATPETSARMPKIARAGYLALAMVGLIAVIPLGLWGLPSPAHDAEVHARWWLNFAAQFWEGQPYPRWLRDLNDGFGSPSFFYYPPWSQWVAAPFHLLLTGPNAPWKALGLASGLGLLFSGLTGWLFFSRLTTPGRAVIAVGLYIFAPFHLAITLFERGAYAEFWTYVWMPAILSGILERQKEQGRGFWWLSGSFAGLFLSHVPTTVTFIPLVFGLALLRGLRPFRRAVFGALVGAGLASMYLIPTYSLLNAVRIERLHVPVYLTVFFPNLDLGEPLHARSAFHFRLLAVFGGLCWTVACAYGCQFQSGVSPRSASERLPWLLLGLIVVFMMLPLSVVLYRLVWPLKMIQLAWRFLTPATLIWVVLLMVFWPDRGTPLAARMLHGAALAATVVLTVAMTWQTYNAASLLLANGPVPVAKTDLDVPEWLPAGASLRAAQQQMGAARVKLSDARAQTEVLGWQARRIDLDVNMPGDSAKVWLHQFWYPGWRAWLEDGTELTVKPDPKSGVVTFTVPPGRHRVKVRLTALWPERLGWWISGTTALGLVAYSLWPFLRKRRQVQRSVGSPPAGQAHHGD